MTPEVLNETLENIKERMIKARKHLDLTKQMLPLIDNKSEKKGALRKRRMLETEIKMLEVAYKAKNKTNEVHPTLKLARKNARLSPLCHGVS